MDVEVRHEPENQRYVAIVGGQQVGLADYRPVDGGVVVTHTETQPHHQGQGIASELTRQVLDDLRARGLDVVPGCPFTRTWLREHPDYQDLLVWSGAPQRDRQA